MEGRKNEVSYNFNNNNIIHNIILQQLSILQLLQFQKNHDLDFDFFLVSLQL